MPTTIPRVALTPPDPAATAHTVVARWGDAVIVLGGSERGVATAIDLLRGDEADEPSEALLIERLPTIRSADWAAAVATPAGWWLSATGNATTEAADDSTAAGSRTVDASSTPIWIGIGHPPADDPPPFLDLEGGIAPGRGATLVSEVAGDADGDDVDDTPAFEVVDLSRMKEPDAARRPLPIAKPEDREAVAAPGGGEQRNEVMGIRCSRDHFNNPSAAYCQVCGISMVHLTHYLVPGQRPTLGFLVFDDGATFALDRSYRIGREPVIGDDEIAPLVLHDARHSVSRSHAELMLDGWSVLVSDLGSTNGTFVWDVIGQVWDRVMPGDPRAIEPGMVVAIGRRTFVFEAVARSV